MRQSCKHIAFYLFICLAILTGCAGEIQPIESVGECPLRLIPSVQSLSTKATAEADRDENKLGDHLDVFFKGTGSNAGFWKEYHLSGCAFTDPAGELLTENWRTDGFENNNTYDVYVIVNGPDAVHVNVGSLSALQAITHTDDEIYCVKSVTGDYSVANPSESYYTAVKSFLMDGSATWTPNSSVSAAQTIQIPDMKRAAAKIVIDISFDGGFLSSLGSETPGPAMFKYYNFASTVPVLTTGTPITPDLYSFDGFKYANIYNSSENKYSITTYSYPFSWLAVEAEEKAPYVVVKIPFTKEGNTVDHYYRFPICTSGALSLERNKIYTVNAVINSKGSY